MVIALSVGQRAVEQMTRWYIFSFQVRIFVKITSCKIVVKARCILTAVMKQAEKVAFFSRSYVCTYLQYN
jgi:hypothetical protein